MLFRRRTRSSLWNDVLPANVRSNSGNPRRLSPFESRTSLRSPNCRPYKFRRKVLRDGPCCRRFVAHWQHAAAPIYCALPRPLASSSRISLRQRYPPSRPLLLASWVIYTFFFSARIFRQLHDFLCHFLLLSFFTFSNSNFINFTLFLFYFYSYIFLFFLFFFILFFSVLFSFFFLHHRFYPFLF